MNAIVKALLTRSIEGIWYWNIGTGNRSDMRWYKISSTGSFSGWILRRLSNEVADGRNLNISILVLSAEEPTWTPPTHWLPKLQLWPEP